MNVHKITHAFIAAAALSATLLLNGCNRNGEAKADLGKTGQLASEILKEDVPTTTVEAINAPTVVRLMGSLGADEESNVASRRAGVVREVKVERGQVVKTGDPLVELDRTDAENVLAQAEAMAAELRVRLGLTSPDQAFDPANQPDVKAAKAELDLASKNFERDKQLAESKVIAPGEFDTTRNRYSTARQKYELAVAQAAQLYQSYKTTQVGIRTAQQTLKDLTVRAPYDGMIVSRSISPGEYLREGDQVAAMVRVDPLRLLLPVPEKNVGTIREGQEVAFTVAAFPGREFRGTVKFISPAVSAESRDMTVEAMVPNTDLQLKPGLFATAQLETGETRKAQRVPAKAVGRQSDTAYVFVVRDGIARERVVVAGEPARGYVEVTGGLEDGETVVADASLVEDGTRIR